MLESLFWAHPDAVKIWKEHPDLVLLDCTYKTNRFRMPLLNICTVTGNKKTVQIGLCFLSGEKKRDYERAIRWFRELMEQEHIEEPICFITDRETALMDVLDSIFPDTIHLLCTWHVNMNILANCRKHFPKDMINPRTNESGNKCINRNQPINPKDEVIPDPEWEAFLKDWGSLLNSATEAEYISHLAKFRKHSEAAIKYVEGTWLTPWKEKLVRYWVDKNLHFGIRVTSPIEGCHATLKSYLMVSTGDLKGVFDRLVLFWPDQHRKIYHSIATEQNKVKHKLNKPYFHIVQSLVHDQALFLIVVECAKLHKAKEQNADLGPCNCTIKQSMGLPCFHTVHKRLLNGGYILPTDIHPFWWYKRPEPSTSSSTVSVQAHWLILDPAVVRGKGRPRGSRNKKGYGITNTRRDPSQFEYAPSLLPPAIPDQPTQSVRPPIQSTAVKNLMAHSKQDEEDEMEEQEDQEDGRFIGIEDVIDPRLQTGLSQSTTQIGLLRIENSSDTYCPGTLPPRLYQANPFSRSLEEEEAGPIVHELASREVAPTAVEIQAIADEEEQEQALSQAINGYIATTRAGRIVKASEKVMLNRKEAKEDQLSKASGRRGRGINRGRGRRGT
jgi:predicted transcriptional regulator